MIFLGIAIPIGILLGLLLFFSGLYNRNRLAAAASGGLDMFTTNFENQLDSVENYLLNLSLNDATFRSLSEQTDRTRAYLDAYEIAQGFPAVLAANDALMGVVLRSGSGNLYVGRYGETAQQLKQKLNLEAYLGQPGQTNKMMTRGWYLRTIGQRLYLLRSVFYQKASLTAAVDLRLVFEELVKDYGLDGRVIVMNDSGNVLVGDANLLPTKMEWNSAGYCMTKMGRDSRLVVRKQVKALTVLYLVPYQHFGVDFAPYQILLVMGAVFVLLAIPFILFYMKQEIFAPMTALVSTMDRIGRGELSVRSSVDYRNAEFTQVNETFNRMIDQITQLKIDGYEKELEARNEVKWEIYIKKVQIEARVLGDLSLNHIIPVAVRYQSLLLDNIAKLKETFGGYPEYDDMSEEPRRLVRKIAGHICSVTRMVDEMVEARKKANRITDLRTKAIAYHDTVAPYLDEIRSHIDDLELMVDNQMWPLPKYRELLFIR